ncbi:gliding motility-associated peptidyl-prolyl isomerase GldI [Aquimarina rhabdastrellae]
MRHFGILIILFIAVTNGACQTPKARKPIDVFSGSFIKDSAKRNKELLTKEQTYIEGLIKKDTLHQYITSEGGFWYYYTTKDTISSAKPKFGDIVNFDYDISSLRDQVIYTKEELKNQNYPIDKDELFHGLREGLKLMQIGEEITFIFPSYLAFGYYGDNDKIGTNVPIKVNVKLNNIKKVD